MKILPIIFILALAGCETTHTWQSAPERASHLESDLKTCQKKTAGKTKNAYQGKKVITPLEQCMSAKGHSYVEMVGGVPVDEHTQGVGIAAIPWIF